MDPKDTGTDEPERREDQGGAETRDAETQSPDPETPRPSGTQDDAPPATGEAPETPSAETTAPAENPEPTAPALPLRGAPWADPIAAFEQRWTWLESRLLTFVLLWQLLALVAWVLLSGISSPLGAGDASGMIFRAVAAATLLAAAAWFASYKLTLGARRALVLAGIALGIFIGLALRPPTPDQPGKFLAGLRTATNHALALDRLDAALVDYFGNIKAWLQDGSTLTLMGGLRGLATRLTLWLALLGASLATAAGKHIHIDVIFRFLPARLRVPAAIVNFTAAAIVCFAAVWGFVDHIAIESFGARADEAASSKIARVLGGMGEHAFLTRKQIGLDARSLPRVLAGERYDQWLTAPAWNAWLDDAGFEAHYKPDDIRALRVPDDAPPHAPLVIAPGGEPARGILINDLNLVFPFGLLVIGIRFLLRAVLSISGHIPVDPDAAHKSDLPTNAQTGGA